MVCVGRPLEIGAVADVDDGVERGERHAQLLPLAAGARGEARDQRPRRRSKSVEGQTLEKGEKDGGHGDEV